jgi:hypothetical protein
MMGTGQRTCCQDDADSLSDSQLFNVVAREETSPLERVALTLGDDAAAVPLIVDCSVG